MENRERLIEELTTQTEEMLKRDRKRPRKYSAPSTPVSEEQFRIAIGNLWEAYEALARLEKDKGHTICDGLLAPAIEVLEQYMHENHIGYEKPSGQPLPREIPTPEYHFQTPHYGAAMVSVKTGTSNLEEQNYPYDAEWILRDEET